VSLAAPLLLEENHDLPLARVTMTILVGAALDPVERAGLTAFAAELTRRGAGGRSRAALDAALEGLGAELDVSADADSISFDLEVLSRNLDPALALFADVILRGDFTADEAERLQRETLAALDELRDDDSSLARRFFARQLFGDHPYGRPLYGTEASIATLSVEGARRTLERALSAGRVLFGAAGDIDPEKIRSTLARRFGVLREGGTPGDPPPDPDFPSTRRLLLVDKPERTQSQILLGHPAPRWSDPDFLPLHVAATAFGGTFTARLMTEVRVKRGLSYGASCRLSHGRGARGAVLAVAPSLTQTEETLELVLRLWREWVEDGLTDDEIDFARRYLAASFAFQVATPEERLDLALAVAVCGLPADYREHAVANLRAVTAAEVRAAMKRRLRASDLAITVVTTAKPLQKKLSKLVDEVEIVAFDSY
jgi:zinc protease